MHWKEYISNLVISSRILHVQTTYAVFRLADARCMLLCVFNMSVLLCGTAMLEAAYEVLSTLYCFKLVTIALYLCDK